MCSIEKKEKFLKKKKNSEIGCAVTWPGSRGAWVVRRTRSHGDLGRVATWVALQLGSRYDLGLTRPGSRCDLGLAWPGSACISISSFSSSSSSYLSLSFFFSFFSRFCCFCILGLNYYFWVETRYPCRRHVEKIPHQMWSTHENRVS